MSEQSPGFKRAMELFQSPMGHIPERAIAYIRILSKKYGYCGEVCLTALCNYVQLDEGLEITEIDYVLNDVSIYADLPPKPEPVEPYSRLKSLEED